MKMKQAHIKAVFNHADQTNNAKNYGGEKETIGEILIIDKKSERAVVTCRCYMGRTKSASTVFCSVWVAAIKTSGGALTYRSGTGKAGGHGYDKISAAVASALTNAGIEFFGSPYSVDTKPDFGRRARIGGTGEHAGALLAVAYAAGYNDCIFVATGVV